MTDPVPQRPHGDHEPSDQEAVAIGDPQLLDAARVQVGAQPRERQEQRRDVHRDQQRLQGEQRQPDPLPASGQLPRPRSSVW